MKVMLTIGSAQWICDSAIKAAKIGDLLGDCTPVKHIFDAGSEPMVFLEKCDYSHEVSIKEVTDKLLITSSQSKVSKLIRKHREIGG
jgi:hypothetical protein